MKKLKYISQVTFGLLLMVLQLTVSYLDRFIIAFLPHMKINALESRVMTAKELTPIIIRFVIVLLIYVIYSTLS
tara:strand:- start:226 stop:447 length:222 start_codon:yes stop_codon:yes gene_type:complete